MWQRRLDLSSIFLFCGLSLLAFQNFTPVVTINHSAYPNLFFNRAELSDLRDRLSQAEQPLTAQRQEAIDSVVKATLPTPYTGTNIIDMHVSMPEQADYAFRLALLAQLSTNSSESESYARRSKDYLMAWVNQSLRSINQISDFTNTNVERAAHTLHMSRGFIFLPERMICF